MHLELSDVVTINGEISKQVTTLQGDTSNNSNFNSINSNSSLTNLNANPHAKVTFNIGGVIFQTYAETILDVAKLNEDTLNTHFDAVNNEYFFDRDPEVFRSILNYWRTGKLHLPLFRCGPSVREELAFWGLEELDIEPCCWNNYNTGIATTASLVKLRRDSMREKEAKYIAEPTTRYGHWRLHMWYLLTTPSYSRTAKIYEICAILFAALAIFSLVVSTTENFHIDLPNRLVVNDNIVPRRLDLNTSINFNLKQHSPESLPSVKHVKYQINPILGILDNICLAFFSHEYVARFLCAPKKWRYVRRITSIVDMLAIIPDYMEFILAAIYHDPTTTVHTHVFILLRLMRVVRIFRLIRRVPALQVMMHTLKASSRELCLMLLFLLVGTLLFGSVIYYVDDHQIFTSIPKSFWWTIVTMTTVGYGDMVPTTPVGYAVGSFTAVCGVLLLAFCIPSLVSNFLSYSALIQYDTNQNVLMAQKKTMRTASDACDHDHRIMMYENIAVFFAVLAIFSLCASTTEYFQIPIVDKRNSIKTQNSTRTEAHDAQEATLIIRGKVLGPQKSANYRVSPALKVIDYLCLFVFTVEYLARLLCTTKRWMFIRSMSALIDMLAILPDYLEFILQGMYPDAEHATTVNVLTLLRLMRVVRILRVIRRVPGLCIMFFTLRASHKELFVMLLFMLVGTLLFGSVIHYVDDHRIFTSIPSSFWWAIVTMTTVGYGDMVPITSLGQLVGSVTAICGVLLIAFSIPSLVNNFICYSILIQYDANQELLKEKKKKRPAKASIIRTELCMRPVRDP